MAKTTSTTSATTTARLVCCICGACSNANGGTLLKCGRCKAAYYCTKDCQAKDWPFHKLACKLITAPMPKDKGWRPVEIPKELVTKGFPCAILSMTTNGKFEVQGAFVNGGGPTSPKITEAPISTALGFSLGWSCTPNVGLQLPNPSLKLLTIDPDPLSSIFGQPSHTSIIIGSMMVIRRDGKYIQVAQVMAFLNYVHAKLGDLRAVEAREAAGETVDRAEIARRLLTPAAFAAAFEREKQEATAEGRAGWELADNPIDIQRLSAGAAT
ncbi:hypothetical protein LTR17_010376 [Elasticomyces elasticus]|nr:hypothetical protein LTR17_010376 [Elasticomyces elasticus]